MIRIQDRDLDIMEDIGKCGLMSYSQIQQLHFPSYDSCRQRIGALQREELISGTFYNTDEKIFVLCRSGIMLCKDIRGTEYEIERYSQIYHKLYRTEFYTKVKGLGVENWNREIMVSDIKRQADAMFTIADKDYLLEVHNEQKTKHLRDKLNDYLKVKRPFTLVIYARNVNPVNNMLKKMSQKGFDQYRRFDIKVFKYGEVIKL